MESDDYVGEISFFFPELGLDTNLIGGLCPGVTLDFIATDEAGTAVNDNDVLYYAFPNAFTLTAVNSSVSTPLSDQAELEFTINPSTRNCNGEISMTVTNNVEVTDITWSHDIGAEYTLFNQCYGLYDVEVTTDYECQTSASVFIRPDYFLCASDLNHDFNSNVQDLNFFLTQFGCEENCPCDLNASGDITIADLTIFLGVFGLECDL